MELRNNNVSVIIPAYNAEKHLSECFDSVLAQKDVNEVIAVNDGSTDGTLEIMNEYAVKDSRVIVLDCRKAGVSRARNEGIKRASSDYLMFVDADDVLPVKAIDNLLPKGGEYADICYGEYGILAVGGRKKGLDEFEALGERDLNYEDLLKSLASKDINTISGSVWRILFSTSFIKENGITFPLGISLGEDYSFMLDCFACRPTVRHVSDLVYLVRREGGSVTQRYIPSVEFDLFFLSEKINNMQKELGSSIFYYEHLAEIVWGVCDTSFKDGSPYDARARRKLFSQIAHKYSFAIKKLTFRGTMQKNKVFMLKLSLFYSDLYWLVLEMRNYFRL